jgi:hypothetical protein
LATPTLSLHVKSVANLSRVFEISLNLILLRIFCSIVLISLVLISFSNSADFILDLFNGDLDVVGDEVLLLEVEDLLVFNSSSNLTLSIDLLIDLLIYLSIDLLIELLFDFDCIIT